MQYLEYEHVVISDIAYKQHWAGLMMYAISYVRYMRYIAPFASVLTFYFSTLMLPSATSEGLEENMLGPAELVYTCFPQGLLHSSPLAL